MSTYIGFSTIGQNKKFTLTDFALIKRDLANAFNIRQGELPGRPSYGSRIWGMLFENQVQDTQQIVQAEIQRIAAQDPRIAITQINMYPQDNGLLVEVELETRQNASAEQLAIFFDQTTQQASLV
jgi:phage baseplate assembly protein W